MPPPRSFAVAMRSALPLAMLAVLAACGHKQDEQQNKQQAVTIAAPPPAAIANDPAEATPLPRGASPYDVNDPLPPAKGRATPDAQTDRYLNLPTGNGLQPQGH